MKVKLETLIADNKQAIKHLETIIGPDIQMGYAEDGHTKTGVDDGHTKTGVAGGRTKTGVEDGHTKTGVDDGHTKTGVEDRHTGGRTKTGVDDGHTKTVVADVNESAPAVKLGDEPAPTQRGADAVLHDETKIVPAPGDSTPTEFTVVKGGNTHSKC